MIMLPTAAELIAAANEGRLLDVVMPTGQKLGDLPALPNVSKLLGKKTLDELTREEVAQIAEFHNGMASALEILGRLRGGKAKDEPRKSK